MLVNGASLLPHIIMVSTRGGATSNSPPRQASKSPAAKPRGRRKSSDASEPAARGRRNSSEAEPAPAAKPRARRKSSTGDAPEAAKPRARRKSSVGDAPAAAKPRARRKGSVGDAPAPRRRSSAAAPPKPPDDVLDEWEPLFFGAGQQQTELEQAEEDAPLFVLDAAPAAANVVRVAYDGGEAELPAPAYFGALRAATAAARVDALERTARRAERTLLDAASDDEDRPRARARAGDATDAALARAFESAQAGRGPQRKKRKTRAEMRAPAKDAGPGWYGLPRADAMVSADDRAALALRGVADPKRHYKRQDAPSEFAQLGTVIAGKYDGASGTLKKRDRKAGLMGELLADTGARAYAKRRSTAVQERQRGPGLSTLKAKRKALARRKKGR